MIRYCLSALLVCVFSLSSFSQKSSHILKLDIGSGLHTLIDKNFSSQIYTGISTSGGLGYFYQTNVSKYKTLFYADKGFYNEKKLFPNIWSIDIDFYQMYLRNQFVMHISSFSDVNYFLGASTNNKFYLNTITKFKNSNNSIAYSIISDLSISNLIEYNFSFFSAPLTFVWAVDISLLTHMLRPLYSGIISNKNKIIGQSKFSFINESIQTRSEIELFYNLENGNKIGLSYFWNYTSYDSNKPIKYDPVKYAQHSLLISIYFSFI
ncbi:hypothetical protein [Ichthyobacterium seriolicida]|uniref:Outer membrane protein beta-barrel domain-containing protein n=1 Tax=Ichthyobacterium seriolicida TaxID=242600 RepID=A0A1J1DZY0_9FLAO|nr:hypothetical protein [Ichthyobacterium seriolicida]BAV94237.1 hypothetical protein JBKA6_0224 [Ichthyobacterium seriolicida]